MFEGKKNFWGLFGFCFLRVLGIRKREFFFFWSVSWDPGGPNVYFSRVFVRDSEAVF